MHTGVREPVLRGHVDSKLLLSSPESQLSLPKAGLTTVFSSRACILCNRSPKDPCVEVFLSASHRWGSRGTDPCGEQIPEARPHQNTELLAHVNSKPGRTPAVLPSLSHSIQAEPEARESKGSDLGPRPTCPQHTANC